MKIVHLCLASFFPDGYAYQENLLPKFHRQLGHEVAVIASRETFDAQGRPALTEGPRRYRNEYDIPVTRLDYRRPLRLYRKLRRYRGTAAALEEARPDILFIHGCQFLDVQAVIRYLKRHPEVAAFADNHADFTNSATNPLSKIALHGLLWRRCARALAPQVRKFYGVLPARVDFLTDVYGLLRARCALLVMGADDDEVARAKASNARARLRAHHGVAAEDLLIVTGGKIDRWKAETLALMDAVRRIDDAHVKLVVFGSVTPELEEPLQALADGHRIQYVGWIPARETYDYFEAADLAVFPGRHSVLWEQAVGQGVPLLARDWPGTRHVDLGGNARFLQNGNEETLRGAIEALRDDPGALNEMRRVARERGMATFSYRAIAERCIE